MKKIDELYKKYKEKCKSLGIKPSKKEAVFSDLLKKEEAKKCRPYIT